MKPKCPCCKSTLSREIQLTTDWGYELFFECIACGVLFRGVNYETP